MPNVTLWKKAPKKFDTAKATWPSKAFSKALRPSSSSQNWTASISFISQGWLRSAPCAITISERVRILAPSTVMETGSD